MAYWIDLFTGTTWKEFIDAGARVSGFSERRHGIVARIQPGDVLLCYLTGVQRWVGALQVEGPSTDQRPIWKGATYPVRLAVKPIVTLQPEYGVPMDDLLGKVHFYPDASHRGRYRGFVRGSPNRFKVDSDGELIVQLLKNAEANPVARETDPKKLARKPFVSIKRKHGKRTVDIQVSIPDSDEIANGEVSSLGVTPAGEQTATKHVEIQCLLLTMGAEMGLDVWVANNDKSKVWNGAKLSELPRVVSTLPAQFNEATHRTIEMIDVLWIKRGAIVAAFEVECTTQIYSGILRMADLIALQPNINIKLYLVAPDERRLKVAQEIRRPIFSLFERPLNKMCGYIPFSQLISVTNNLRELKMSKALRPDVFLDSIAEYFD